MKVCGNNLFNIQLNIPVIINENILYKYNPMSSFYNDICYLYKTEYQTDMTLYDRKRNYNKNNLSLCPKDCEYIEYYSYNQIILFYLL